MKEKIKSLLTKIKNNKKKVIGITLGVFLTFIFTFTVYNMNNPTYFNRLFASIGSVPNEAFEDSDFYNCIVDTYNNENSTSKAYTDSLTDEELASITSLKCSGRSIENAKGLEKLTGLISLNLGENKIISINLNQNLNLEELNLEENKITNIDLSNNIALKNMNLGGNKSISINGIEKLTDLEKLYLNGIQLTSIDLSKNTALMILELFENQIESIDLSKNINLESLSLFNNKLKELNLSNNIKLKDLDINNNPLIEDILLQNGDVYTVEEKIIPPSGQSFSYSIDDTSIASISGNVITALQEGSTTLRTSFGNISYERRLSVDNIKLTVNNHDGNFIINHDKKYIYLLDLKIDDLDEDFDYYFKTNYGKVIRDNDTIKVVYDNKTYLEYKLAYINNPVLDSDYFFLISSTKEPNKINNIDAVNCTYEISSDEEIIVKYDNEEINRKKLIYIYFPENYISVSSYYFDIVVYNKVLSDNDIICINNTNEIIRDKINIRNAKKAYLKEYGKKDTEIVLLNDSEEFMTSLLYYEIHSELYNLLNKYIYIGTDSFKNDINLKIKSLEDDPEYSSLELENNNMLRINDKSLELFYVEENGIDTLKLNFWDLIKVSSDTYDMSGDVIDLKGEDIDISKINVTNANLKVDNNKLLVMYDDEVVKEFILENVKKEDTTTKPSKETTTRAKVTTKEDKTTTTKKTTTKKKSIIDKIFGKSETTTKKEETTTTNKTNILRRTNKTTKIESNSDTINNNSKNSNNKIVTKNNILILLLGITGIGLIIYIVINKKKDKEA